MDCSVRITVYGRVQGVGFRPFVAELAEKLRLSGTVQNSGGIVRVTVRGNRRALDDFIHRLSAYPPVGARVDRVEVDWSDDGQGQGTKDQEDVSRDLKKKRESDDGWRQEAEGQEVVGQGLKKERESDDGRRQESNVEQPSFRIVSSEERSDRLRFLPPDIATCDRCLKELLDPDNRRYRYPFISCTDCGPRFSIMEDLPYDRDTITMRDFTMCPQCREEYTARGNIRRHAQTIACEHCGPEVVLYTSKTESIPKDIEGEVKDIVEVENVEGQEVGKIVGEKPEKAEGKEIGNVAGKEIGNVVGEKAVVKEAGKVVGEKAVGKEVGNIIEKEAEEIVGDKAGSIVGEESENIVGKEVENAVGEDAVREAVRLLLAGKIVAIKDIGGYHFAFDPNNSEPARHLREFKQRENKPFAVMFPDLSSVQQYCEVSEAEKEFLLSASRPIVLLRKKPGMDFVPEVCGNSSRIGALLPCNPLQQLLLNDTGPLVMTSANRGGEPIITENEAMLALMEQGCPDAVLAHDRRICFGLDDSILQVTECDKRTVVQIIRRARGFVPEPVELPVSLGEDVFAAGGDLKAVFALGRDNMAYLSGHFGDLEDMRAQTARWEALTGMSRLLDIAPKNAACDQHPDYHSVKHIQEDLALLSGKALRNVQCDGLQMDAAASVTKLQHHHAHIAAVLAEHQVTGMVLGVAYDGTGYGVDGTIWGGEFLLCEGKEYQRVGHIDSVPLIGGDLAAKNAEVTAWCYLCEAQKRGALQEQEFQEYQGKNEEPINRIEKSFQEKPCLVEEKGVSKIVDEETKNKLQEEQSLFEEQSLGAKQILKGLEASQKQMIEAALRAKVQTVSSSSMGRLFDAAAAILGICPMNTYEGECPERLQAAAEQYYREYTISEKNEGALIAADQDGLAELSEGFEENQDGLTELSEGFAENQDGLTELSEGFAENQDGLTELPEDFSEDHLKGFMAKEGKSSLLHIPIYEVEGCLIADTVTLIALLARYQREGIPSDRLAYEFHQAVAEMTVKMCDRIFQGLEPDAGSTPAHQIALGGGSMYNSLLLQLMIPRLEARGYQVYINERVPSGDGGLAYGQLYLSAEAVGGKNG